MNNLPRDWITAVMRCLQREAAVVRIVVAEVRGSAPREPGAFMLVTRDAVEGTIGGGRLEWESIAAARELLAGGPVAARLNKVVLGVDLGQCCGGAVTVWLERLTPDDLGFLRLALDAKVMSSTVCDGFVERKVPRLVAGAQARKKAGMSAQNTEEVGAQNKEQESDQDKEQESDQDKEQESDRNNEMKGVYPPLNPPMRGGALRAWVERDADGRESFVERLDDAFPQLWLFGAGHVGQALARILVDLPLRLTWVDARAELFPSMEGVCIRKDADSVATLADAPAGAYFLVMTHSHPLDYELCQTILKRGDFAWLGLIGSDSKAARFRSRLRREGVGVERLTCPIGIAGIESKWPAAIAVGVAAQVMQLLSAKEEKAVEIVECKAKHCESCGTVVTP